MPRPVPTSAELLEDFRQAVETTAQAAGLLRPGQRLKWEGTSRLNLVRTGCVRLCERVLYLLDDRFRASFLDTAVGPDLDVWAASEAPGYPRNTATAAQTVLTLSRSAGTLPSGTLAAGARYSTVATPSVPAVTFTQVADVAVGAAALTAAVTVQADQTGLGGNVSPGTVTVALTAPFDAAFNVITNVGPAAGGGDAESDDAYRGRLRQRDARYRRGTLDAVRLGARSVPGVAGVTIREGIVMTSPTTIAVGSGLATVVVADQAGLGSQPLADATWQELENWRACGVAVSVLPATATDILTALPGGTTSILVTVTTDAASRPDVIAIERNARVALAAFFSGTGSQRTVHPVQLARAVMGVVAPGVIRNVTFTAQPSGTAIAADFLGTMLTYGARWGAVDGDWRFTFGTE